MHLDRPCPHRDAAIRQSTVHTFPFAPAYRNIPYSKCRDVRVCLPVRPVLGRKNFGTQPPPTGLGGDGSRGRGRARLGSTAIVSPPQPGRFLYASPVDAKPCARGLARRNVRSVFHARSLIFIAPPYLGSDTRHPIPESTRTKRYRKETNRVGM